MISNMERRQGRTADGSGVSIRHEQCRMHRGHWIGGVASFSSADSDGD